MQQITKQFETSRQAERYLEKLYGMYSYVRLIIFPRYSESGTYIFEVNN
jgi:hypothetical protein